MLNPLSDSAKLDVLPVSSPATPPMRNPGESRFTKTRFGSFALFCVQHPDLFRFLVQVAFSGIVLGFCINQLALGAKEGKNDAIYWGGVTSILAWWMPSPGGGRLQNQANIEGDVNVNQNRAKDQ